MKHYPKEVIERAKKLIPIIQAIANNEPTEYKHYSGNWKCNCNGEALYNLDLSDMRVTPQRTYIDKMGVKSGDMIINNNNNVFEVLRVDVDCITSMRCSEWAFSNRELEEMQAKKIQIIEPE